jgi:hypothetical protein
MAIPLHTSSTGHGVIIFDMDIGEGGDLFVTGSVVGTADFNPGMGEKLLGSRGSSVANLVLCRYTPQFSMKWANTTGDYGTTAGYGIAIDPGTQDILLTGSLGTKVDFDFSSDTFYLVRKGYGLDIFLARYDADAKFKWAFRLGDVNDDQSNEVVVSKSGKIGICGAYSRKVDFNPNPTDSFFLEAAGDRDAFVSAYHADGRFITAADTGTTSIDFAHGVAIDPQGYIYFTGQLSGSMFTGKIDSLGRTVWMMRQQGGVNYINGRRIFIDKDNKVILTSMFTSSFTPVNGGDFLDIKNSGGSDIFVLRYSQGTLPMATKTYNKLEEIAFLAPVPVQQNTRLIFKDGKIHTGQWTVISMDGKRLYTGHEANGHLFDLPELSKLPNGMYLFEWKERHETPLRISFLKSE